MSTEARPRRAPSGDGLFLVGVVGRAGSGKSVVARALEARGAERIDADHVGHEVTDSDPEVREALMAEYGPAVYRADRTLDRARVAERVFHDPEARARLDRLVHPRIRRRIERRLGELRSAGWRGVVVLDAALLLEWGLERECDAVIAVVAPDAERVARLAKSRGWTPEEVRARHAVQRSDEGFAAAADLVLENRGSLEDLERAAVSAIERLRRDREPADPGGTAKEKRC